MDFIQYSEHMHSTTYWGKRYDINTKSQKVYSYIYNRNGSRMIEIRSPGLVKVIREGYKCGNHTIERFYKNSK